MTAGELPADVEAYVAERAGKCQRCGHHQHFFTYLCNDCLWDGPCQVPKGNV